MKKANYIPVVIVIVIACLFTEIHAKSGQNDIMRFKQYYYQSREELWNYAKDFIEIQKLSKGQEFWIAYNLAAVPMQYVEHLNFTFDLIGIFSKINRTDRKANAIIITQTIERIVMELEQRIRVVNICLNCTTNQNVIILGNQMKRKPREIIGRLKSLSFD